MSEEITVGHYSHFVTCAKRINNPAFGCTCDTKLKEQIARLESELAQLREQLEQRWIKVGERVPEEEGMFAENVIACGLKRGSTDQRWVQGDAWFEDGKFWEYDSYGSAEQIFPDLWQPLPTPPKG